MGKHKTNSNKSKNQDIRQSKPVSDPFEGKDLCEDWGTIYDGYGDLLQDLQPDNPDCEVDKVVKFILDQNIPIRYLEIKYNHLTSRQCHVNNDELQKLAKANLKLRFVRFRPGKGGEGDIIQKNWDQLMHKANVANQEKCYRDIFLTKFDVNSARKRNVVSCYLGQGLPFIRISSSIANYAREVLGKWNTGKFSKEDDEEILSEVTRSGENGATWKTLAARLNRFQTGSIIKRHLMLENSKCHSGKWRLVEDEIFLGHLFRGRKESCTELIQSISVENLKPLVEILGRSQVCIYNHWQTKLKPTLLSHLDGQLHFDWVVHFFKYLVEQRIVRSQDIIWPDLLKQFPCQTNASMTLTLRSAFRHFSDKDSTPIHEMLTEVLNRWKFRETRKSPAKSREDIAHLFDKVRGVSD